MANPQIENGHTKIANDIVEALSRINLSPYESRVLWCIIRKTYGWNKKMDRLPITTISDETGMHHGHVSRALSTLVARSICTRAGTKYVGVNKNYDQWVPKLVRNEAKEEDAHDQSVPELVQSNSVPELVPTRTGAGTKTVPELVQKKDSTLYKDIKHSSKDNIYIVIFDAWNSQKIKVHRNITDSMKRRIDIVMKDYNQSEIVLAINTYGEIVNSDDHYFNYKWGLEDFLQRGIKKFDDPEVAKQNFRKDNNGRTSTNNQGHTPRPGSLEYEYQDFD